MAVVDWQAVFEAFGGQAALLLAIAYLGKTLISSQLSKETEAFKIKLQGQTDVEIERLKSSLQIAATEHQIKFSKLHDRRARVIAKLYRLLLEAADAVQFFAAHPGDKGSIRKEAIERSLGLYRFSQINKIYLPSAVCGLLENYETTLRHSVGFIRIYMSIEDPNEQTIEQQNKVLQDAWQALEKKIPSIRTELETEFRQMLGVE